MRQIIEPIVPAVLRAKMNMDPRKPYEHDQLPDASVRQHVTRVVLRLRNSEALLIEPMNAKKLREVARL